MKKIVPFKKDINFKTNISEITSIALDHDLFLDDHIVKGNLVISGSYKINDVSLNVEEFKYNIPVNIEMSDRYILDNLKIDINDFYYEVIDNNILNVSIEISLDDIDELENPIKTEEVEIPLEDVGEDTRFDTNVKSLFDNFDDSNETFKTYRVCIVKENDTIDSILLTYGITKELLSQYNDISDIKINDKLIIPSQDETD